MTGTDFATWLGTVVSIASGLYALNQAKKSARAADLAESMRDSIISYNSTSDLSEINAKLTSAINAMEKYAPGSSPQARRGLSPNKDATHLQALLKDIALHSKMLSDTFGSSPKSFQLTLTRLSQKFGASTSDKDYNAVGCELYILLTNFSGELKSGIDNKIFQKK